MMTADPAVRVDVLMTAYNSARTIVASVSSILEQDYRAFRMIVVDDGSSDETPRLLEELAQRDPRLVVIREPNQGIVGAANLGLSVCTAEYVARLDSDDLAFSTRLRRQVEFLDANPDCVAVSVLAYHIDVAGKRLGSVAGHYSAHRADPASIPSREPYIMHPFVMMRRAALVSVGGYRHVDFAEDTDLYWRLGEIGRLEVIPEFLGEYRIHEQSVSSRSIANGRISAINSQLAAISTRRRRAGVPDLVFTSSDMAHWRSSGALDVMLARAASQLTREEETYLRLAVAAKLLELNSYRPYEFELSDCSTLNAILVDPDNEVANLPEVKRLWGVACARLLRQGYVERAMALYDGSILIATAKGLVIQIVARVLPKPLRRLYRERKSRRAS